MINLFNIPNYTIDISQFSNLLSDKIVNQFTREFCDYVGINYGCPLNSASNAIYLIASDYRFFDVKYKIPTMIPPVVVNSLINAKASFEFTDDTKWVGHSYIMTDGLIKIIDSAQEVIKGGCQNFKNDDIIIYSFYPTKPIGTCDGGMICSNNEELIDHFSIISNNGSAKGPSWENKFTHIGWKMYMNSIQAYIARENLKKLDEKREKLKVIRNIYNSEFKLRNTSEHLYRVKIKNRSNFINETRSEYIMCGIHYHCCHINPIYEKYVCLPKSEEESKLTISIPYHENLTYEEIDRVIKCVKKYIVS